MKLTDVLRGIIYAEFFLFDTITAKQQTNKINDNLQNKYKKINHYRAADISIAASI